MILLKHFIALKMPVSIVLHSHHCSEQVPYIARPVLALLKRIQHFILIVWWQQSHKMLIYLFTSFVDGLLAFSDLSEKSPLLLSVHRDVLVMQCCLLHYLQHRYMACSLRTYNKHPKQRCVHTAAGIFQKLSRYVIRSLCARFWQINFIPHKWETQQVFSFSPPSKSYDTVTLAPSQKSFLCFTNSHCLSFQRLFRVGAVTRQLDVVSKALEKLIPCSMVPCTVLVCWSLVFALF